MAGNGASRLSSATQFLVLVLALATAVALLTFVALGIFVVYIGLTAPERDLQWSQVAGIAGTIGVLALILAFLLVLRKIVSSIGDPFTLENANRLRRLGWIALAWQIVALIAGMIGPEANFISWPWLRIRVVDQNAVSGTGPMLVLSLFILAHVFRRGAEMREELDGTV